MKITLAFNGGSRDGTGAGFGNYVIVKGYQRTVTRLEFGGGMSDSEAGYDTLIMGLKTLIRQEAPSKIALEIQTPDMVIVSQVKGSGDVADKRLQMRRDQVSSLLEQFASYNVVRVSPDRTTRMLNS